MAHQEGVGVLGKLTMACFLARYAREDRIRGFIDRTFYDRVGG